MADPFIAEIRMMSFNYPPKGWAFCNGQLLPINQNQALFSLIGTIYGGNGQTNFALPDLRARTAIHKGNGHTQGERSGEDAHTLTLQELPAHLHTVSTSSAANGGNNTPTGRFLGGATNAYAAPSNLTTMRPGTITNAGGSQPHQNDQPYLVLSFCIALVGIFPSHN